MSVSWFWPDWDGTPPADDLAPADLADARCPDCGHPRTCGVCSCTGPGTCEGGTDDVEF